MMTGGFGCAALAWGVAAMLPVAGSIRTRVPSPNAYSEPSALAVSCWLNDWWSISSAPQGPPGILVTGVVCSVEEGVWDGDEDAVADVDADGAGGPPAGGGGGGGGLAKTARAALAA